jgi:hypothetical protein
MFNAFKLRPDLTEHAIETYSVQFQLDRLVPGVDNFRYDVYLSPAFCASIRKVVRLLFQKHAKIKKYLDLDKTRSLNIEQDEFKRLCRDVLHAAVNKAKSESEIQIDLLAQIAVIKKLSEEIQRQHKTIIEDLNQVARKHEISSSEGLSRYIQIKEKLSDIQQNKKSLIRTVGEALFRYFIEVQREDLTEMRGSVLGGDSNLPDDVFANPILHVENPFDDYFMIDEYVLLAHRSIDPDSYQNFLILIRSLFRKILLKMFLAAPSATDLPDPKVKGVDPAFGRAGKSDPESRYEEVDIWLKHVDNIPMLFDSFKSRERYKILKEQKETQKNIEDLKKRAKHQDRLLNFIYKKFNKAGLINRITASYEMKTVYNDYCPPLVPQQVLQYLIQPQQRKGIVDQLNRLKKFYGKSYSLLPLKKKIRKLKTISKQGKKKYLIQFLNDFVRYHRDFQNFLMLREALDRIHLLSDKKMIELSRENRILYEFLLPDEQAPEVKPPINQVIIKADVRDSSEIILKMKEKGLNPASFFSLNFFVPITSILFEYAAEKVFIEGDAVILSIFEHEDTPQGWYSVSRACGLAVHMLDIVRNYNMLSRKHKLPVLELGIGISFYGSPPTFLFDESNRIMISPAINSADRMSKCSKPLYKTMSDKKRPFNLYVFESASTGDTTVKDDLLLRYNVNGIELDADGFDKLSKEIHLESLVCDLPELREGKITVHTGKYPSATGKYRRLVIREGRTPVVAPNDFSIVRQTDKPYYEVCTHPLLIEYIENLT